MRQREVQVRLGKVNSDKEAEKHKEHRPIEEIADAILYRLESVGAKIFLGLCIYVVLDTYRQTSIERVKRDQTEK